MRKRLAVLSFVVASLALPISLEAAIVCAVNSFGQFFRFDLRDRCTATKATVSALNGRWHPGFPCNGLTTVPIHGTCTGDPTTNQVIVSITAESSNGCVQVMWLASGPTIDTALGVFDNAPFNGGDAADAFSPAACASEPPLGPDVAEPAGPGPIPGRQ